MPVSEKSLANLTKKGCNFGNKGGGRKKQATLDAMAEAMETHVDKFAKAIAEGNLGAWRLGMEALGWLVKKHAETDADGNDKSTTFDVRAFEALVKARETEKN